MSKLQSLISSATFRRRPQSYSRKSHATRFLEIAAKQIELLKAGKKEGAWIAFDGDKPIVTLRNGNAVLKINGDENYQAVFDTPKAAIQYINLACDVVKAGELDALLAATARKRGA